MDFVAHLLWSLILFRNSTFLGLALFFSVLPDLFSWLIWLAVVLAARGKINPKNISKAPKFIFGLYNVTHSVFVFAISFIIVMLITDQVPLYMSTWLLHILVDIPLHTRDFLPTPFLWPFADWRFPGITWANRYFIVANYASLVIVLLLIF
jgi:hypothetical protein